MLHLSTQWGFASIRRLALNNIQPPSPHDQLLLARTYSVDHWVIPALSALCERIAPLSVDSARQMNVEDIVIVAAVRENIRSHTLQVDMAEIPGRVEAAQAGKPVRIDSVDVRSAVPTSGADEQVSSPMAEERAPVDHGTNEVGGEALVSGEAVVSTVAVRPGDSVTKWWFSGNVGDTGGYWCADGAGSARRGQPRGSSGGVRGWSRNCADDGNTERPGRGRSREAQNL